MAPSSPKLQVPNPAAWLGSIWDRMPDSGNTGPALKAWTKAFALGDQDARVFEAVGCFLEMGNRTKTAVEALRGLPDSVKAHILGWTPALDEIVHNTAANGAWSNIRAHFNAVRREQLKQCEVWLDEQMLTGVETRSYLESLLRDIDAMRSEIQEADLEDDFRCLLMDILEALRRAVAEYEIRGSKGVFDSIGEIVSMAARYQPPDKSKDTAKNLTKKMWELVKKVASVGSTASGLTKTYLIAHEAYDRLIGP